MRAILTSVLLGLSLCGCATTKSKTDLSKVDVRAAKLVEKQEFDADGMYAKANEYYAQGNFKSALAAYNMILLRAPEDFEPRLDVMIGYGDAALALGHSETNFKKAETAYQSAEIHSELSDEQRHKILSGQVLLEIARGESLDAEVRLNEALETNLDDPRLWNALGRFHDKNGEWLVALETYVKALHVANEGHYPIAPVVNNMGVSLLLQKRTGDALVKFDQAYELNPENEVYDNNRRLALILVDRIDKAVENLTDKKAALIYNDAGYLSAATGKTARARYFYKKAIELSPTYFEKAELNLEALSETSETDA